MFRRLSRTVVVLALLVGLSPAAAWGEANENSLDVAPTYELQFTVPPPEGGEDLTLENHFIQQLLSQLLFRLRPLLCSADQRHGFHVGGGIDLNLHQWLVRSQNRLCQRILKAECLGGHRQAHD